MRISPESSIPKHPSGTYGTLLEKGSGDNKMNLLWIIGIIILIGCVVNYGVRRAVAAMLCIAGAAALYLAVAPGYHDRLISLAIGLVGLLAGIIIFRCNHLWLKNGPTILATLHADGVKAAILAQLRYIVNEFFPRKAAGKSSNS